jgi:hypothetical protein
MPLEQPVRALSCVYLFIPDVRLCWEATGAGNVALVCLTQQSSGRAEARPYRWDCGRAEVRPYRSGRQSPSQLAALLQQFASQQAQADLLAGRGVGMELQAGALEPLHSHGLPIAELFRLRIAQREAQ